MHVSNQQETETYSELNQTSTIELFANIVNGFQLSAVNYFRSIVDVWQSSEYFSEKNTRLTYWMHPLNPVFFLSLLVHHIMPIVFVNRMVLHTLKILQQILSFCQQNGHAYFKNLAANTARCLKWIFCPFYGHKRCRVKFKRI